MSSRKRSRLYDEESREGTEEDTNSSDSSEISNKRNKFTYLSGKNDVANKIAIATARVIIGLSNKNQTLNKNIIAKILEAENEKGSGLQFKKFILPILDQIFANIFSYKIVELPSKKSKLSQQNLVSINNKNNKKESNSVIKNIPSDDFILINNLPPSLRALNYSFMAEYTQPIGKSLKAMDKPKQNSNDTNIYGENLPRPTVNIIEDGITLLIICIILLHNNNILQSDLILILKTKFGLTFKENEIVSILGNQTLNEFLTMLNKRDYIDRSLITNDPNNNNNSNSNNLSRSINSKTLKYDDNMLIVKLGRRCFVEWGIEEFVGLFRQLMQDQWTEQLQECVLFTVNSVWKQ